MKTLKTIVLIAAMGIISNNLMAQKRTDIVPQSVLTDFSAKYPQAHLKNWKTENDKYMASFALNKRKYTVLYSKDGSWLRTEKEVRHITSLPPSVRTYLKKSNYASWYIDEIENVKTPSQNMYMLQIDNNSGNKMVYEGNGSVENETLYFNDDGKLVRVIDND